jgi:4-amino-4-deoxy-L-arabinose transferase-like glycosyltransferase
MNQSIQRNSIWIQVIIYTGAMLTALFLYTYHLNIDLYGDERGHTYHVIAIGNFWTNIQDPSIAHPPLYFILAKLSYDITGQPWGMRIPSVLFALGTVIVVSFAAKEILGKQYFLTAAWLAALSPFVLEFSAEGRAYAMLIFFSVTSFWAFLKFIQKENIGNMLWLAGMSIGSAFTHYFFWFQLIFFTVYYLFVRKKVTRYSFGVFLITAFFILPFPILIFFIQKAQFREVLQVNWGTYFNSLNFLARLYTAVSYGYSAFQLPNLDPARNVPIILAVRDNFILICLVAVSTGGLLWAWINLARKRIQFFWFFVLGIIMPVTLGIIAAKSGLYLIREKHLAIIWIFYFFLLLLAFNYLREKKWGWVIIVCYMTVVLFSIYHYLFYPNDYTRKMDWTGLIYTLENEARESDTVVVYQHDIGDLSLKKVSLWNQGVKKVILLTDRPNNMSIADYAKYLDQSIQGNIYIVNNETDRLGVDPNSELLNILMKNRLFSEQRFGRNLILYEFRHSSNH